MLNNLASRLARVVLNKIVFANQFGFIRGRCIQDYIVGTSECVNGLDKKCFRGNIDMKINIHKAFDTLNSNFLLSVMQIFFREFLLFGVGYFQFNEDLYSFQWIPGGLFSLFQNVKGSVVAHFI